MDGTPAKASTDHVTVTRHDRGVVLVRMNRFDKKNALTGAMYDTMRGVIENAAAEDTRAVVFAGGPGVFTSGNDIGDFIQRSAGGRRGPRPATSSRRWRPSRCPWWPQWMGSPSASAPP